MSKQKFTDDEIVQELARTGGNRTQAAQNLGMNVRSLFRRLEKIDVQPVFPVVPDGQILAGVSSLQRVVDPNTGETVLQWVKTKAAPVDAEEKMQAIVAELIAKTPRVRKLAKPKRKTTEAIAQLANLHILTDYHMGMLAWDEETGGNWDLQIAEDTLIALFEHAIATAPEAHTGILGQLGDFLHYDSFESVTPRSKHILDSDSRPQKMIRVAIRALRRVIDMMLLKYDHVHVLMAEGNHDIIGSAWLRESFSAMYENEPRVTVEIRPDPYYVFEWGQTALFFHHGHMRGPKRSIDQVFTRKFREVYGRCTRAYAHLGHLHHEFKNETTLMKVEQHPTLAEADAHASRGGWLSDREAKIITYHKQYGFYSQFSVTPEMLKDE